MSSIRVDGFGENRGIVMTGIGEARTVNAQQ